jgi:4-hydroxy-tetrahydrodipicolinate synthase
MAFRIDGIVPILPTPFHDDESIVWEELGALVDFAVAAGACAVCLPAYASEFYKLSEQERLDLVRSVAGHARGRLPVIAQVNSPSLRLAREWAAMARDAGASAICSAAPRLFPLSEDDLFSYFDGLLSSLSLPFVLQDFHPGGASLSVTTVARLHHKHPHFRYIKLEDARLAAKVAAIREATNGGLGVLAGWGGMYMLELIEAGISGVVPGLALTDILDRVFRMSRDGNRRQATVLFEAVLPQILFSLQNLELFHHAEKRLLEARGVLRSAVVRQATVQLSTYDREHIGRLNDRILRLLDELGIARDGQR